MIGPLQDGTEQYVTLNVHNLTIPLIDFGLHAYLYLSEGDSIVR